MTSILRHVAEAFPSARQGTILNSHRAIGISTNILMVLNWAFSDLHNDDSRCRSAGCSLTSYPQEMWCDSQELHHNKWDVMWLTTITSHSPTIQLVRCDVTHKSHITLIHITSETYLTCDVTYCNMTLVSHITSIYITIHIMWLTRVK